LGLVTKDDNRKLYNQLLDEAAIAIWLQSTRPVGRVAELGSLAQKQWQK